MKDCCPQWDCLEEHHILRGALAADGALWTCHAPMHLYGHSSLLLIWICLVWTHWVLFLPLVPPTARSLWRWPEVYTEPDQSHSCATPQTCNDF